MKTIKSYFTLSAILVFVISITSLKAQNTGPSAPETMSFEPVDVKDMVNLSTGDMSYVIPLLEVPGPEGGYPIALSYHGGITLDQEASWVGLGWNINPGAINRSVSSLPDDWKGDKYFEYISEPGGTSTYNSFSVYFPLQIFNPSLPSIGLNFSWGDYRGFGGSISYGPLSIHAGTQSMGISYNGIGISVSAESVAIEASVGTSLVRGLDYLGLSKGEQLINGMFSPGLGISLNSKNGISAYSSEIPLGFKSFSTTANENSWSVTQTTKAYNLGLVSYAKTTINYFLFMAQYKTAYGLLHTNSSYTNGWELMDVHPLVRDNAAYLYPQNTIYKENLVLPSPDAYAVSGQGISGNILPRFEDLTYIRDENNGNPKSDQITFTKEFPNSPSYDASGTPYFYFDSENVTDFRVNDFGLQGTESDPVSIVLDRPTREYDSNFYNTYTNRQYTGNYVEWFTNSEIKNADPVSNNDIYKKGFLEADYIGDRNDENLFPQNGIGAFSITVPDGKTYHYSVPVYQFEEFVRTYDKTNKDAYQEQRRLEPYAYTWLLTAITGPDYIDRGGPNGDPNGKVDANDYGYWVKFNYGKWTDGYIWQLPAVNPNKEFPYHTGRKQIYYLNTISTRSHTAYFIKSIREDGKGASSEAYNILSGEHKIFYPENEIDNRCKTRAWIVLTDDFQSTGNHPVLKLDKILLLPNDKQVFTQSSREGSILGHLTSYDIFYSEILCEDDYIYSFNESPRTYHISTSFNGNYEKNVFYNYVPNFQDTYASRVIDFSYDYSAGSKLTLKSLNIKGKGGKTFMPPYLFDYYLNRTKHIKDNWGFNSSNDTIKSDELLKNDVDIYSLKNITTPVGANITIEYESDKYNSEAVFNGLLGSKKNISISNLNNSYTKSYIDICVPGTFYNCKDFLIRTKVKVNYVVRRLKYPEEGGPSYDDLGNIIPGSEYVTKDMSSNVDVNSYCSVPMNIDANGTHFRLDLKYCGGDITRLLDMEDYTEITEWNIPSLNVENMVYTQSEKVEKYGGGLRVKAIKTVDPVSNNVYQTQYDYFNGQTSYAPHEYDFFIPYYSEIPGPGVLYSEVEVRNSVNGLNDDVVTRYKFKNYDDNMAFPINQFEKEKNNINDAPSKAWIYSVSNYTTGTRRNINTVKIIDALNIRGALDEVVIKNQKGQELSHSKYFYRKSNEIQQSFLSDKLVKQSSTEVRFSFCTSKATQNFVLDKTEEYSNGRKSVTSYESYDPVSGSALLTKTVMPNQDEIEDQVIPAYHKYTNMGSKVKDINYKNMLVQQTANYTWYKKEGETRKVIQANVQTWANAFWPEYDGRVWRKHQSYIWRGSIEKDGSYSSTFYDYVWNRDNSANGWVKTSEITRYDHYSAPLEAKDINGNYASTRMGYNDSKVLATASNASYKSFAYTGFEFEESKGTLVDYGSEFMGNTSDYSRKTFSETNREPHTGLYYLAITGPKSPVLSFSTSDGLLTGRKYRASVWMHENSHAEASLVIEVNGSPVAASPILENVPAKMKFGKWVLVNTSTINIAAGDQVNVYVSNPSGGTTYIDDIRFQPVDASVTAYAYDDAGNVSAILNNDNFAVKYEYDAGGRLVSTHKETQAGFKMAAKNTYTYARNPYLKPTMSLNKTGVSGLTFSATDGLPATSGSTYSWNFGNGVTSNSKSGSLVYSNPGTYLVTLNVTNPDFGTRQLQQSVSISYAYEANFGYSADGGNVSFSGTDGVYSGSTRYFWDFGDGGSAYEQQNPTHTYISSGTYTVTLEISNPVYGSRTISMPVTVTVSGIRLFVNEYGSFNARECDYDMHFAYLTAEGVDLSQCQVKLYSRSCENIGGTSCDLPSEWTVTDLTNSGLDNDYEYGLPIFSAYSYVIFYYEVIYQGQTYRTDFYYGECLPCE